jgi:hypothetical protein
MSKTELVPKAGSFLQSALSGIVELELKFLRTKKVTLELRRGLLSTKEM